MGLISHVAFIFGVDSLDRFDGLNYVLFDVTNLDGFDAWVCCCFHSLDGLMVWICYFVLIA